MLMQNKLFEDIKPLYKTYRVTPDFNVENNQNEVISRAISTLYKTPLENFTMDIRGMQVTYKSRKKILFDILLIPGNAYFYFTLPIESIDLFLNKIKSIWSNSAIIEVDSEELERLNDFNDNSTASNLVLKDFNFKSLNTSKDNLHPLSNMIGIVSELKADRGEMVRLNFDIEPIKRSNWINKAKDEYESYKKGKVLDNEKTLKDNLVSSLFKTLEYGINMYIDFRLMIFESLLGVIIPKEKENEKLELVMNTLESTKEENKYIGLSGATTHKMSSESFSTGITIISKGSDVNRRNINLTSVANSYKDINGDNELIVKKLNDKQQKKAIRGVLNPPSNGSHKVLHRSTYSDKEIAKFIQLPQKSLQQLYKLDNIDTREVAIHEDLRSEGISIGVTEIKRDKVEASWCNDYNSMALSKIVTGSQGSGKSKYTSNFIAGANKLGHSTITFDYIKNCELTNETIKHTNNNVVIDLSDINNLPSFSYPEMSSKLKDTSTPFERIEVASDISKQIVYLINAITDTNTGPLTSPMIRYLKAAARIVFIHPGETLDNCLKVLEDWKVRNEYIRKSKGVYNLDDRVISTLKELNDTDTDGKIIGTRSSLIIGVLNRIDKLQDDPRLELMLKAESDNLNFTQYMNEGKAVYIKMPQNVFKDKTTKDIIVTYFMTRIIMSCYDRSTIEKPLITHIVVDEVHQIQTAATLLKDYITEFRKFGIAPFFTVHYLKQFKALLDAVKSSGASYMILNGTEKESIQMLKEELDPFTIEEALSLKEWESLNIIRHNNKYSKFISKLPKPLE